MNAVCDIRKADVWASGLMAYEMVTGRNGGEILSHSTKQVIQYTLSLCE